MSNPKVIVILGPTSSGKSEIAIKLAKQFNGEIISADSRQIYRGLDIGTGKVHGTWNIEHETLISNGITHYGIDIVSPRTDYNVAKFQKYANKIIKDILRRKKLPIICGGTGFWIKAVVDNVIYPEVKPDWMLRNILRNKTKEELFSMLQKLDSQRAKNIDKNNPVRLIRAIEICKTLGKVPEMTCHCERSEAISRLPRSLHSLAMTNNYIFLQIGLSLPKEELHAKIKKRLKKRFETGPPRLAETTTRRREAGMIEEVKNLHEIDKLSWKKIESFGLGYLFIPRYIKGKIKTKEELFEHIYQAEKDYAKRQITWFRKDKRILWLANYRDIEKEIDNFIKLGYPQTK